jgi:hypothetical protein
MAMMSDVLEQRRPYVPPAWAGRMFALIGMKTHCTYAAKVVHQLVTRDLTDAMTRARAEFDSIEIDRLRVRPIVKLIGEFWAQTTDGDGNFRMVRFLEEEKAEAYVDRMIGTRIMYIFHLAKQMAREKRDIDPDGVALSMRHPLRLFLQRKRHVRNLPC